MAKSPRGLGRQNTPAPGELQPRKPRVSLPPPLHGTTLDQTFDENDELAEELSERSAARRQTMPGTKSEVALVREASRDSSDAVATYMRDAKWFSSSFGADEKKTQVNKLLRGSSSKLTREIMGGGDEATSDTRDQPTSLPTSPGRGAEQPRASASSRPSSTSDVLAATNGVSKGVTAGVDASALMSAIERMERTSAAKDAQISKLASALIASERRHDQMLECVTTMHTQLSALTTAVGKLSGTPLAPPKALPQKLKMIML